MDLAQTLNLPVEVTIGGKAIRFSEFTLHELGQLQAWIKAHVAHPLDAIKGHLDGFSAEDRDRVIAQARAEARDWPPSPGTKAFSEALFNRPDGLKFAMRLALAKHQPTATDRDVKWLLKAMNRDEPATKRIIGILFGNDDPDDLADDDELEPETLDPKG